MRLLERQIASISLIAFAGFLSAWLMASDATAQGGPDYWQVYGVPPGDVLNLRFAPGAGNRIVATARNGDIFRNRGCSGSGTSRWCRIETMDGRQSAWASGRFLRESGAPAAGDTSPEGGFRPGTPEVVARRTGEIEVRWDSGCTMLYNPVGNRLQTGGSCSRSQRSRSDDAVARYLREQGGFAQGGGGAMNVRGYGNVTLGGPLTGEIFSRNGRTYALILTATRDRFTCTGSFRERPFSRDAMTTTINCTNGSRGTAILNGKLLTFSAGGKGGLVRFR